ncbi:MULTISPECIES: DUF4389 domain-containing protein [Actinomadura]|uniref:DUF4389 domain-containing protein n=1 Tax=Actinomadura yumaensis TaxID=111807 RepID=A0ABW2CJ68_9ACTN|nr:DUF4389 domain-containing protein [Actinomadura sp. J1-007]MWK33068.1 DUF4389 domain-containing protein [Actinomadura sp. J1-007]
MVTTATPTAGEWPPALDVDGPGPQSRVTVLLRLILMIPQIVVVWLLSIAAYVVAFIGWFAALALGRLPAWAAEYLSGYLAWSTRVSAYGYLLSDAYPPFRWTPSGHPVRVDVRPGRLNRLAVLFRIVLMIPAAIVSNLLTTGWRVAAIVIWLVVLVRGGMPQPLFEATAAVQRYSMRFQAYVLMLTPVYPKHLFGDQGTEVRLSPTRPLVLGGTARNLVGLFILLGVVGFLLQAMARMQ